MAKYGNLDESGHRGLPEVTMIQVNTHGPGGAVGMLESACSARTHDMLALAQLRDVKKALILHAGGHAHCVRGEGQDSHARRVFRVIPCLYPWGNTAVCAQSGWCRCEVRPW